MCGSLAGPLGTCLYSTPLGSPTTGQKQLFRAAGTPLRPTYRGGAVYQVGIPGWVYRVGNRRGIPVPSHAARGRGVHQRSGPRKACRAWSGWVYSSERPSSSPHPLRCAPGPAPLGLLPSPGKAASGPIRTRFHLKYTKVSQNG